METAKRHLGDQVQELGKATEAATKATRRFSLAFHRAKKSMRKPLSIKEFLDKTRGRRGKLAWTSRARKAWGRQKTRAARAEHLKKNPPKKQPRTIQELSALMGGGRRGRLPAFSKP